MTNLTNQTRERELSVEVYQLPEGSFSKKGPPRPARTTALSITEESTQHWIESPMNSILQRVILRNLLNRGGVMDAVFYCLSVFIQAAFLWGVRFTIKNKVGEEKCNIPSKLVAIAAGIYISSLVLTRCKSDFMGITSGWLGTKLRIQERSNVDGSWGDIDKVKPTIWRKVFLSTLYLPKLVLVLVGVAHMLYMILEEMGTSDIILNVLKVILVVDADYVLSELMGFMEYYHTEYRMVGVIIKARHHRGIIILFTVLLIANASYLLWDEDCYEDGFTWWLNTSAVAE
jgi:hypothetical protein